MVDDESKPERRPAKHMKSPQEWDLKHNPAYAYYAFYTYANLYTLNKLREARGLNTFALRPHAGEHSLVWRTPRSDVRAMSWCINRIHKCMHCAHTLSCTCSTSCARPGGSTHLPCAHTQVSLPT